MDWQHTALRQRDSKQLPDGVRAIHRTIRGKWSRIMDGMPKSNFDLKSDHHLFSYMNGPGLILAGAIDFLIVNVSGKDKRKC
jgi:hypothetical protein